MEDGLAACRLLLDAAGSVNEEDDMMSTELLFGMHTERPGLAFLLAQDDQGRTALHAAAEWGRFDTASEMMEFAGSCRAAALAARDHQGRTALHLAAREGRAEVAALLLLRGADALVADDAGAKPGDLATSREARSMLVSISAPTAARVPAPEGSSALPAALLAKRRGWRALEATRQAPHKFASSTNDAPAPPAPPGGRPVGVEAHLLAARRIVNRYAASGMGNEEQRRQKEVAPEQARMSGDIHEILRAGGTQEQFATNSLDKLAKMLSKQPAQSSDV